MNHEDEVPKNDQKTKKKASVVLGEKLDQLLVEQKMNRELMGSVLNKYNKVEDMAEEIESIGGRLMDIEEETNNGDYQEFAPPHMIEEEKPPKQFILAYIGIWSRSYKPNSTHVNFYPIPTYTFEIELTEDGPKHLTPEEFEEKHGEILQQYGARIYYIHKKGSKAKLFQVDMSSYASEYPMRNPHHPELMEKWLNDYPKEREKWAIVDGEWVKKEEKLPDNGQQKLPATETLTPTQVQEMIKEEREETIKMMKAERREEKMEEQSKKINQLERELSDLKRNPPEVHKQESIAEVLKSLAPYLAPTPPPPPPSSKAEDLLLEVGQKALTGELGGGGDKPKSFGEQITEFKTTADVLGFEKGGGQEDSTLQIVREVSTGVKDTLKEALPLIVPQVPEMTPEEEQVMAQIVAQAQGQQPLPLQIPQQTVGEMQMNPQPNIGIRPIQDVIGEKKLSLKDEMDIHKQSIAHGKMMYEKFFDKFMKYESILLKPGSETVVKTFRGQIERSVRNMPDDEKELFTQIIRQTNRETLVAFLNVQADNYAYSLARSDPDNTTLRDAITRTKQVLNTKGGQVALLIAYDTHIANMPKEAITTTPMDETEQEEDWTY